MKRFIINAIYSFCVCCTIWSGALSFMKMTDVQAATYEKKTIHKRCYPYDKYYLLKKWLPLYVAIFAVLAIYFQEKKDNNYKKKIAALSKKNAELEDQLGENAANLASRQKVGQQYEKYVGSFLRRRGYNVNYNGIKRGFDDEGIDLICKKSNEILLVQCKNWASDKIIHENYIFQLYGAWKFYEATEKVSAIACFCCTCKVTNQARIIARILGVKIKEEFKILS